MDQVQDGGWPGLCVHYQRLQAARGRDCDHIQKPLDDRTLIQTDKAELPAEVLLGRAPQCYQDADLLRTDGPAADAGDQEKVGNEEVVRQHDHRDQTAPDELSELYGVHQ